jgi:hypothetical protein
LCNHCARANRLHYYRLCSETFPPFDLAPLMRGSFFARSTQQRSVPWDLAAIMFRYAARGWARTRSYPTKMYDAERSKRFRTSPPRLDPGQSA